MLCRRCLPLLATLMATPALAADKLPDLDLLEFLGSVDADAGEWSEYLENTDLDKLAIPAKPTAPAAAQPPARAAVPPVRDAVQHPEKQP
jgi:hypothetical protein